ncbi:MAG TPA: MBG domain-containing protein, partial [Isosphaeraceae bacterium]
RSYVPVDPGDVKLPAGQNLFLASPLSPSSGTADVFYYKTFSSGPPIQEPLDALTTNPAGQSTPLPSTLSIGGVPDTPPYAPSSGHDLALNTLTLANQYILDQIIANNYKTQNYVVTYKDANNKTVVAGTVVGMYTYQGQIAGVELSQNAPVDPQGKNVYTISSANFDYAAGTIAGLWYSWAQYYAMHETSNPPPKGAPGTIAVGSNVLTLNAATSGLVPGMAVTATGLPPGAVILSVGTDNKTITLSVAPTTTLTGVTFNFAAPSLSAIAGYDATQTPLVNLDFSNVSNDEQVFAKDFAQTVYVCMSAWSASVHSTPGAAPGWIQLLTNVIGGNLNTLYLPNANLNVVNTLTDLSKSALRGVPDFTSPLYSDPAQWYPDPSLATGGLAYNAFNLDPYVWFVHDKLGLTAYGFALDDDIGNVNAGGATNIAFAVGGLTGLPNRDPYTNVSPWGVVEATASNTTKLSSQLSGLTGPNPVGSGVVAQIQAYDYNHATPGTLINGPGIAPGTTVQFTNLTPNLTGSTIDLSNPLSASSTSPSYSFFGTLVFQATLPGPTQSDDTIIVDAQAGATLAKLGPLGNIQVDGAGIDPAHPLNIVGTPVKNADGSYTITLSGDLDPKLVSVWDSYYGYRFGLPSTGVIHDPGFEWRDVSVAAGDFNHGKQLSAITPDWTFTDSLTNANWYAGIAFDDKSTYTSKNPPAPQGLQVGFIQGDSSISQVVTLAKGRYILSLVAAQRAKAGQPAQTLDVYLGNTLEGTIAPADKYYKPWSIKIDVPATGQYTLTFKGATVADSTALIDSVGLASVSPSLAAAPPISLGAIPNQLVSNGSTDTFTAHASGLTSPLTYSLAAGAPRGARIDPDTGVFTWTPTTPGVYSVTVDVADNSLPPLSAQQTITITVLKATSYAVPAASLAAPVYGQSQFFGAAVATVPALGLPTGTVQFYVDGLKFGAPVPMVNAAAFSPSIATLGAGVHYVAAVYPGDANYAIIATPVLTETIARAPLLVVANASARVYGQPNFPLTASYYGFVNGDTPASLTSPAVVATLANQFSPVGTYGIAVAGATSPNYAITFLPGMLTVLPTPAGATRQGLADSAFVTTLYEEILGRIPDIAGFDFWVQTLARGVSEAAVASAFWNSREHVVLVASGRAPLILQAVVLQDAQAAAWIAFVLGASVPPGPLG